MLNTEPIAANVLATFQEAALVLKPPPKLSVTEWAEVNFVLSSEDSAEPGAYRSARAPYQREILDAVQDPEVEEVVLQCAAQTVKTMAMKIWIAYFVKEDPSSMIFVLPDIPLAKRVSRQRLAPMFRDVPVLQGILELGANKASNSTLEKSFPGGVLFLVGANSPAGLASVPVRILLADEVNRYPASAGSEGDPIKLAEERTTTFWNAKKIKASTPTDEHGAITRELESSDFRQWYVPCPGCVDAATIERMLAEPEPRLPAPDGYQVLTWRRMQVDKEPPHTNTCYPCQACGLEITEKDRQWMNARGRWIPLRPEIRNKRGYQLSALYSPFVSWAKLAAKFLNATVNRHNRELLKTFVNLSLAEAFNEEAEALSSDELMGRREDYPCQVPDGVSVLTAAVDVQHDRLEFLVRGWGKGQESWLVDRKVFVGNTSKLKGGPETDPDDPKGGMILRPSPWEQLDAYHERAWYLHARGVRLPIYCTFVDSGDQTSTVYEFVKPRQSRWIYATKGVGGFGKPPLGNYQKNNRGKVRLYLVGVDEVKSMLHRRLRIGTPGAGYVHFPKEHCDTEYFKQLTAEHLKWKNKKGFKMRYWEKAAGAANEALDLEVLAYAAFLKLSDKPEEFLAAQRQALLEKAAHAKAARRGKMPDPSQLTLAPGASLPDDDSQLSPGVRRPEVDDGFKNCDNPLCDRRVSQASAYCCHGCNLAHEGKYEIHEAGLLGHSESCNARDDERSGAVQTPADVDAGPEPTPDEHLAVEPDPPPAPPKPKALRARLKF